MKINFKKLGYVLMAIVVALTLIVSMSNAFAKDSKSGTVQYDKYKLGAKIEKNLNNQPKVNLSKEHKLDLPSVVDHSSDLPPVGDQGGQGSCVGWATSYYKGYQEKADMGWGNVMFSPSFVYNQINGGSDDGAYQSDAYALMQTSGNCRLSTMPYDDTDWLTQPNATQLAEAENYKADSWSFLYDTGYYAAKTDSLKEYLQDDCLTIGIPCYADFWSGFYDVAEGTNYGGHALCVVGYDDSKSAFKFINSWSTSYGYDGYGYISYDLWDSFVEGFQCNSYGMEDADSDPLETPTPTPVETETPTPTVTETAQPTSTSTPTPTSSPSPAYKYTLTFKDARVVSTGSHSAGNQWGVAVKNESKSTMLMYKRQNNSNPITVDKSMQTNYDGCYLGLHEYEANPIYDDRASKIVSKLSEGNNIIYLTCYDKQYTDYWSKWRFIVNLHTN